MENLHAIKAYTKRQSVALEALRAITREQHLNDLEEIREAESDIIHSLSAIYHVLRNNVESHNKCSNFEGLEDYERVNSVALLAMNEVILRALLLEAPSNYEDAQTGLELLMYDLNSLYDMLAENMDHLWNISDKGRAEVIADPTKETRNRKPEIQAILDHVERSTNVQ